MLRLSILTSAEHRQHTDTRENDGLSHDTEVLKKLVAPWAGSGRTVVADCYFDSVEAAEKLGASGLRFIGVVNTAHRRFPMASLSSGKLCTRDDHVSMVHIGASGTMDMMAVFWPDNDRH